MRDSFDLRQGYLDFHYKPAQLIAGRQELRIGDERVVGLSDERTREAAAILKSEGVPLLIHQPS
jgi:hypothetical protein